MNSQFFEGYVIKENPNWRNYGVHRRYSARQLGSNDFFTLSAATTDELKTKIRKIIRKQQENEKRGGRK